MAVGRTMLTRWPHLNDNFFYEKKYGRFAGGKIVINGHNDELAVLTGWP